MRLSDQELVLFRAVEKRGKEALETASS